MGSSGTTALVLDAGGARSAYQVGALRVLLPELEARGQQPRLLVGTSAGALLGAGLASTAHLDAEQQAERLTGLLDRATKSQVMRPLWRQVPEVVLRYASETLGLDGFRLRGLFGTAPLAETLTREIDWGRMHRNLEDGLVSAVAVTTTAIRTGEVVLFTETAGPDAVDLPRPPDEHHRRFVSTRLDVEHLMASAAIPALFPSVQIREPADAAGWYVDGATRRRFPLAPALELGAERVAVIGTGRLEPLGPDATQDSVPVDLGDAAATLLGSVMDEPLRHDLHRIASRNAEVRDPDLAPALAAHREARGKRPHREVPYVGIAPHAGDDLADLALEVYRSNHGSLRRTLRDPDLQIMHRLLGSDSPLQGELLSYLLFDRDFFDGASDMGRRDAERWMREHPDLWTV
ncbi:patatin-like phospholipase family protein [Nocardioidaceae bacterium]|nr:patatin-like phospholipase family protein [Nocardioidaceae bacterium]